MASELPGELVPALVRWRNALGAIPQTKDSCFPVTFLLSPIIPILRSDHYRNPGDGKNTFLILPRAAGSYLLHWYKQERYLHNCMEKWKQPANVGSCVWQNETPSALVETMEGGKQQD